MSVFKKIGSFFAPRENPNDKALWIYVQCGQCGEKIRTRVNIFNDLSIQYGEDGGEDTYLCRKTIIGTTRCFRRINVSLTFNTRRQLADRKIDGGAFITAEEFEAAA